MADAASRNQAATKIEQRGQARAVKYTTAKKALDMEYEAGRQSDVSDLNAAMAAQNELYVAEDFLRKTFDDAAALAREKELADMSVRIVARMQPLKNEINPAGREDGRFPSVGNRLAGVQNSISSAKQTGRVSKEQLAAWEGGERGLKSQLAQVHQRLAVLQGELNSVNEEAREISLRKLKP